MPKTAVKTADHNIISCLVKPELLEKINQRAIAEDLNRSQLMTRAFKFYLSTPID